MILDEEHILLISKCLTKEATEKEIEELHQWIAESEAHKAEFESYKKAWESATHFEPIAIDINAEWEKLKGKTSIGQTTETKIRALDAHYAERYSFKQVLKIAAILLILIIPAGVYFYINQSKPIEIVAIDAIKENSMPDGSKISLNHDAVITYHKDYGKTGRQVALKGEAFFSVAPDKSKPFIVDANDITITVTGTSFFVQANPNESEIKVMVESGSVIVKSTEDPNKEVTLNKGDKAIYSRTDKTLRQEFISEEDNYHSWLSKKLLFKEIPLKDIIRDLNHVYHRNISIKDEDKKAIENCRISVSFEQQSLDQILNVIKNTIAIQVKEKEDGIEISGKGC